MSTVRPGEPGATRDCPHCRETILESAVVCPACRHYLRYGVGADSALLTPLCTEGRSGIRPEGEAWEGTVAVSTLNDRVEIARKLIGG
jgi:hypothetical protein